MTLKDYLEDYLEEHQIDIGQNDLLIFNVISLFKRLYVNVDDIDDCIREASIFQLYYTMNTLSIALGQDVTIKSYRATNYDVTYSELSKFDILSPIAKEHLLACGKIQGAVPIGRPHHRCLR